MPITSWAAYNQELKEWIGIIASSRAHKRVVSVVTACISLATLCVALPARAEVPPSSSFGPVIDNVWYEGQENCSPAAKPGMLAFQRIIMTRYPNTGLGGISRACHIGGQSEHKEGRAWDWGVSMADESDRAIVKEVLAWLLAEDRYGNEAAMARRFGIMYLIWNRRTWGAWKGWDTYCVQKRRGCVDPDDGDLRSPHTDHVHFSMSRAGARKQTTFWNRQRSMLAAVAPHPSYGYWELGRNGGVAPYGTGWYGSKSDVFLPKPAAAMASTISGSGYWIVTKGGRVFPFGDARNLGQLSGTQTTVVDIEPTPSGKGYWLLAKSGGVFPYGDATVPEGAGLSGGPFAGMAATPTGLGYWLFSTGGEVFAFGDAVQLGDLSGQNLETPVIGGDNAGGTGYWIATAGGRVASFGDAPKLGQPASIGSPVVGFAASPTGAGYWVLTEMGGLWTFGDAASLGSLGS